jgi:hypothetical protein
MLDDALRTKLEPLAAATDGLGRQIGEVQSSIRRQEAMSRASAAQGLALAQRLDECVASLEAQRATMAQLPISEVRESVERLEELARANELQSQALAQRLDECVAFLQVQHDAVRDALDRLGG